MVSYNLGTAGLDRVENSSIRENDLEPHMKSMRLMIADDHQVFVDALRRFLEPYYEIVGTANDGLALLEGAKAMHPDVVVADMAMPVLNGLNAAPRLKTIIPNVKLIFLTMNDDPSLAIEAMRGGASGYVLKKSGAAELIQAIQMALKGNRYVSPELARGIEEIQIRNPQGLPTRKDLSQRQREVLQLLTEGKLMKEIADILDVTPRTVAFHKYRIMEQLGIKTNAELIQFAIENHLCLPKAIKAR